MTREEHLDGCLVQADARIRELEQILKAQVVAACNERITELEVAIKEARHLLSPYIEPHLAINQCQCRMCCADRALIAVEGK